ncbi:heparinase II/III family protein [Pelagibius sp. Alg239-R121]|uniref:heparinase II/III family protein n=1 Tax=Pelagibius sp. Alg239-R121 TaxID=2993448 RepID=UPI0024A704E9|nr:heparinase II/III family protein [Pelagibius sp. Alg239-R121]
MTKGQVGRLAVASPDGESDRSTFDSLRQNLVEGVGEFGHFVRRPADQVAAALWYQFKRPFFSLAPFGFSWFGPNPTAVRLSPTDPWPGNADEGAEILAGSFHFAGSTLRNPAPLWRPPGAPQGWVSDLHSFFWLRDLRAVGGDAARRRARDLVGSWLAANDRWSTPAWEPVVLGQRLTNWLGQYEFFAASADVAFRHRLLEGLVQQARHLSRVLPGGLAGCDLIMALQGLICVGACIPGCEAWLDRGLALLERELGKQILADGGHIERSPSRHLKVLRALIDIRALLHASGKPVPASLATAIENMAPILRLLRHGDGGLALFNGSNEDTGWQIDMMLQRADGAARSLLNAPDSGFQRLQAGRSVVIVDTGSPPRPGYDRHAHAGTLAFELSAGRERLIVNCGAQTNHPNWQWVQRSTAAHSTAVLGDTNSSELGPQSGLFRTPRNVACRREEVDGNTWLDMSHDGYAAAFGIVHHRRLFLSASGDDLRGEDRFEGTVSSPVILRFHLHPDVNASLAASGDNVLLRPSKGAGWQFRARGGDIALEQSVYLGRCGEVRRCEQIVVSCPAAAIGASDDAAAEQETEADEPMLVVKWAIKRVAVNKAG